MPLIDANGARHYYRLDGREERPVLVLSHSLGCDHSQWDAQAHDLETYYRVLRYDIRGHGASDVTSGDYTIELLAKDALGLADALGVDRFAFCGLSLGGMIGQWIASRSPKRVTHLVLANTSSHFPDTTAVETRRKTALEQGMQAVEEAALHRFFTEDTLAANRPAVARVRRVLRATDPRGYAGCCAAVRNLNQTDLLAAIEAPTLIVVGDYDVSTPWTGHGDVIAGQIPDAQVEHLPAAHLSNVERPRSFTAALLSFLMKRQIGELSAGTAKRREILGDAHVDRAQSATTKFTREFQELITRYAWGTVWQRPGLDDRTRRLLVLAATAALGRWEEFRLHVRAGLAADLEACDIKEALLQTAVYAGVPAANTGFHIASEEIANA